MAKMKSLCYGGGDLISHVLFPWETFAEQGEREKRELEANGARWTPEFRKIVRGHILRYADMKIPAIRSSCLNEVYRLTPIHFRGELFSGVSFPLFER